MWLVCGAGTMAFRQSSGAVARMSSLGGAGAGGGGGGAAGLPYQTTCGCDCGSRMVMGLYKPGKHNDQR